MIYCIYLFRFIYLDCIQRNTMKPDHDDDDVFSAGAATVL